MSAGTPEFKDSILDAIGNTPLVRLNKVSRHVPGEVYVKCEFMNPGGSIKDRIGKYMVEIAEKEGKLTPGGTIVESTSGNTGMGLAITAAVKGYRSIFVMPDKMSEEKRQNLRAFGAKVVITPTGVEPDSPLSHYKVGERIARETPNAYYVGQYHNTTNRDTHYHTTGPEIFRQTGGGQIDAIICGMGTCGTISGIGRYFKEKKPSVKIIGVDPKGSILKEMFETGKMPEAHTYKIEGIGEDMMPQNCDFSVIDKIVRVEDKESFLMTRSLLTKEGIFCGISCGSAVVGALRYLSELKKPERVLVILPDSGNRYLSKVYNDAWMIENSFLEREAITIGGMLGALGKHQPVLSAKTTDKVGDVVQTMRKAGVSQLPVFSSSGQVSGVIAETALLRPLISGSIKATDTIESLVDNQYALVQESDPVDRLNDIFTSGKIAFVGETHQIRSVVTKIDLIGYLSLRGGNV